MICHEPALYPAVCSHSAPAAILAGALLKDNETGEILAQLKLKNVQAKPIKALTISLQALDTAGQKLGSPVSHPYLDLSIPQDGEFGQKDAIVLPHVAARGFQPKVTQVIFSDGTLWETGGEARESIPPQVTLEKALGDEALCKEYRVRFPGASYTQLFCSLVFALITGVLWLICVALPGFSRKLMGLDAGLSFCCGLFLLYVLAFPMGARAGAPDLLLVMTLLFLIAVFLLYYFTFHIFKTSNSKGE